MERIPVDDGRLVATQEPHDTNWNEARRLAGKNFTCVLCSQRFNEKTDLQYQDDLGSMPVCPYCFEMNGGEKYRTEYGAEAAEIAAGLTQKHLVPPVEPGWFDGATAAVISAFSSKPLTLTRGGASVALTLTGVFTEDDTFTYGGSGISDAVAVAITDEDSDGVFDQVVLTVQASGGATLGLQSLTLTSGDVDDVYPEVFDVRA
jgi:hypothetical protein